jgi:hypothetical protein
MARYTFTPAEEIGREQMFFLGHFHESFDGDAPWEEVSKLDPKSRPFREATASFQNIAELHQDQVFGEKTVTSLVEKVNAFGQPRICGCPDIEPMMELVGEQTAESRISNGTVTLPSPELPFVFGRNFNAAPGMNKADTDEAYKQAFQDWNAACGVNFQVGDYDDADCYQYLQGLRGGTLAIALLSQGRRGRHVMWQKYDSSNQRWNLAKLRAVIEHETGHSAGYNHSSGGPPSIMRAYMSNEITRIQDADKNRFRRDYGPPLNLSDPDVPDTPTPEDPDGDLCNGTLQFGDKFITIRDGRVTWVDR